jgi:hypothetical protein
VDVLTVATFGLVFATVLLMLVTAGLYWESRRLRVEANLVAFAAPWEMAYGLYPAILIENAGPAVARDVTITWTLTRPAGNADGVLREPAFPIGFRRTILPTKGPKLDDLAKEGAAISIELAWRDGRRGTQRRRIEKTCEAIRADYTRSGALPRASDSELQVQIRDALREIRDKLP